MKKNENNTCKEREFEVSYWSYIGGRVDDYVDFVDTAKGKTPEQALENLKKKYNRAKLGKNFEIKEITNRYMKS